MGAAGSHLTRYMRRFNVINRTERVISKEKPKVAPLHKIDAERLKQLMEGGFLYKLYIQYLKIQCSVLNYLHWFQMTLNSPKS